MIKKIIKLFWVFKVLRLGTDLGTTFTFMFDSAFLAGADGDRFGVGRDGSGSCVMKRITAVVERDGLWTCGRGKSFRSAGEGG